MTKEPRYITDLKRELRGLGPIRALEDVKRLEDEVYHASSDRARVILVTSYLDNYLDMLLMTKMRGGLNSLDKKKLFEYEGVVGTLSSKITLSYALGLLGKETHSDLNLIRILRNEFAHSRFPADFSMNAVQEFCSHLKLIHRNDSYVGTRYRGLLASTNKTILARSIFLATCDTITHRIFFKANGPREGDIAFENDESLP